MLLLWVGLLLGSPAHASDRTLCPDKPIRFAHYEMGMLYNQGAGIDEDILQALIKRSGCTFTISVRPRARIWHELERGTLDMAASGIETEERARTLWFAAYLLDQKYVLLGPRVPANITTMQQFVAASDLTMGGVRSFKYSPHYDPFVTQLEARSRFHYTNSLESLYKMFAIQRFDATIATPLAYRYYLRQHPFLAKIRIVNWDTGPRSASGLVLSKKSFNAEQARQWQSMVQDLLNNGTVLRILTKHLGADDAKAVIFHP